MLKFDHLTAAQDNVRHASNDKDRLLVQLGAKSLERWIESQLTAPQKSAASAAAGGPAGN